MTDSASTSARRATNMKHSPSTFMSFSISDRSTVVVPTVISGQARYEISTRIKEKGRQEQLLETLR